MDVPALEARARQRLDPVAYDYFAGGADDELTLRENEEAWRRVRLLPRVLHDVSSVSAGTSLLGTPMPAPILVAPMAAQRLADDEGELAMARAAARTGTVMVVSTMATVSLEDVAAAAPGAPRWFQVYVHRDRDLSADLVRRAVASGYEALVLTVDVPVLARRRRDEANRFDLPEGMTMANLDLSLATQGGSALAEYSNLAFDPALTPDDIAWLGEASGLPVVVKGVLRPDDATRCVAAGAAAVIVSNHGGRQLDGAVATAEALPPVVDAVDGAAPVLVDGGIRSGADVVRALAMGATAVLVGRPLLWGLALAGADGAQAVIEELTEELKRAMALCGAAAVGDLDRSLIAGFFDAGPPTRVP
jgi:isopentenyl diphosphate isomerase/L-lactate dehydrogenase-like FMN-dependent dehydrogenase